MALLNRKGQLSIFFGMMMILLITVVAFIVNIGMLVKAKINLQNAVDAAAYSGASVQARLLTSIAYVNWEMRNTYKEWMFKYWVLGNISNPNTDVNAIFGGGDPGPGQKIDYRLRRFQTNENEVDQWNIPSICIRRENSRTNLRGLFTVPGLPRTETQGAVGIDETFNQALNDIIKVKTQSCIDRSITNLRTAVLWAYGAGIARDTNFALFQNAPVIAAQRTGAWTEAFELALRMRNLEFIVNQPPVSSPICLNRNDNCTNVTDLNQTQSDAPALNERPVKAFWAAYRNLGNSDQRASLIKDSFKLTELRPQINQTSRPSDALSFTFLPPDGRGREKIYLDLQVYLLNYVTFFSSFIPKTRTDLRVPIQGDCAIAKVGLPVPSYPFGFIKNPNFLTYYAVKGEADFIGLFNPFNVPLKLKAYAAAKPYGGRIGPHLFKLGDNGRAVEARDKRTFPFAIGLQSGPFDIGMPVPTDTSFWVLNDGSPMGGIPDPPESIRFVIPNMIYDVPQGQTNLDSQNGGALKVEIIPPFGTAAQNFVGPPSSNAKTPQFAGLYEATQFKMLKDNLVDEDNNLSLDPQEVQAALIRVRKPTKYDSLNYMIPTIDREGQEVDGGVGDTENINPVEKRPNCNEIQGTSCYRLYAPLFHPELLYTAPDTINFAIQDAKLRARPALNRFLRGLAEVADFTREQDRATAQQLYVGAANNIHNQEGNPLNPTCPSLAGQFRYFFTGTGGDGGVTCLNNQDLESIIKNSFETKLNNIDRDFARYIEPTYANPDTTFPPLPNNSKLKSGYAPGIRHGATAGGIINHPFLLNVPPIDAHRNFYSSKFVALSSLLKNRPNSYIGPNFSTYSEGLPRTPVDLQRGNDRNNFANPLSPDDLIDLDPDGLGLFN